MLPDLMAFARCVEARRWSIWEPNCYAGPLAAKIARRRPRPALCRPGRLRPRPRPLPAPEGRPATTRSPTGSTACWPATARRSARTSRSATSPSTSSRCRCAEEAPGVGYLRTQYIPYGGPAVVPGWLTEPPKRAEGRVHAGAERHRALRRLHPGRQEMLDELGGLDVEVVATIADSEKAKLGPGPGQHPDDPVRPAARPGPHLRRRSSTTRARRPWRRSPATASPNSPCTCTSTSPPSARRLAAQGAGIAIGNDEATGAAVRDAVERLLTELGPSASGPAP